jgi:hypothetical protein
MWRLGALAAVMAILLAGLAYVASMRANNARLSASVAALQAEVAIAERTAAQKAEAARVARAEAERLRAAAAEYDAIREWIIRSDDNAPIPPLLRAALDRILRGPGGANPHGSP